LGRVAQPCQKREPQKYEGHQENTQEKIIFLGVWVVKKVLREVRRVKLGAFWMEKDLAQDLDGAAIIGAQRFLQNDLQELHTSKLTSMEKHREMRRSIREK